jgi:hypothetical protein
MTEMTRTALGVDLEATAFVHAHPGGDQAAPDELAAHGVTLAGGRP